MKYDKALEIKRAIDEETLATQAESAARMDLLRALDSAGAFEREPTITKAQAYEIARRCALSGGRHYWAEPEFDKAWAAVTGEKP